MKFSYLFFIFFIAASCVQSNDKAEDGEEENSDQTEIPKVPTPRVEVETIATMSPKELRIARNTVYAKYGRVFKSKDLKEYFGAQSWYNENPRFKESDLKENDRRIVQLIKLWEAKTDILFRERIDLTGNGSFENCYVLYNENNATFALIINEFSEVFDHYWGQVTEDKPPKEWAKINIEAIDIHPDDGRSEIHIYQRFNDWEDPGTENIIASFDTEMRITKLSSTDYDAGTLTFNENGTVTMQVSNCPEHTADYKLDYGKLVKFDEKIGKEPPGGCAACFTKDALVDVGATKPLAIDQIKAGSPITTYDLTTGKKRMTEVKRVLSVYHENLYSIRFGKETLETTEDHPFFVDGKGWCSLNPTLTMARYDYDQVALLKEGDALKTSAGKSVKIESINAIAEGQMTYTIESLVDGNTFIVNGIIVGTEKAKNSIQ